MTDNFPESGATAEATPHIGLQKVYLKDASYEAPGSPGVFSREWKPRISLNMTTRSSELGEDSFEVVLEATVEAKQEGNTAFLAEIQQAGIFTLHGFSDEELKKILSTFCPTQLYPYARESVADLVSRGGFPQLHLQPVSFEAMVAQAEAEADAASEAGDAEEDQGED